MHRTQTWRDAGDDSASEVEEDIVEASPEPRRALNVEPGAPGFLLTYERVLAAKAAEEEALGPRSVGPGEISFGSESELSARLTELNTSTLGSSLCGSSAGSIAIMQRAVREFEAERGREAAPSTAAELRQLGLGHLAAFAPPSPDMGTKADAAAQTTASLAGFAAPDMDATAASPPHTVPFGRFGRAQTLPALPLSEGEQPPWYAATCPGLSRSFGATRGADAPMPTELRLGSDSGSERTSPTHLSPSDLNHPNRRCPGVARRAVMRSPEEEGIMERIPGENERPGNNWRRRPWHTVPAGLGM
jgi:hypothetical protein